MSDIINLQEVRDALDRNIPVAVHDGQNYYLYSASYVNETGQFSFDFRATSMEDAERRIKAMRETLILDGEIMSRIEVSQAQGEAIAEAMEDLRIPDYYLNAYPWRGRYRYGDPYKTPVHAKGAALRLRIYLKPQEVENADA